MVIIDDDVWLCDDCTIVSCNGDTSGIETKERIQEIEEGLMSLTEEENQHLCLNDSPEDGEGQEEFSHRQCESCKTNDSGRRTRFAIIESGIKEMSTES